MPRYDYRCPSCNTVFEVEHGMRERPEILCPTCGTPAIRQFKTSSIVFKGSGFYNTDQRGKKGSTKATAGKAADEAAPAETAAADTCAADTGAENTAASDTAPSVDTPTPKAENSSSDAGASSD